MKKVIITAGILAIAARTAATAYCWTTENESVNEEATITAQKTAASAGSGKSPVVYFSVPETDGVDAVSGASRVLVNGKMMGNTQYVASIISEATGSDLFEIKTERTYPGTHKALIDAAKEEHDSNARPKLTTHIRNLKDYDIIFVGFPNWWYDMPMPLYSFFDEYDFGGKTVIPFCTHGGSRFSSAIETIRTLEPKANVLDGRAISRDRVPESRTAY